MYYKHEYDKNELAQHTKNQVANAAARLKIVAAKKKAKNKKEKQDDAN
jgi:hypothetical protein